MSLQEQSAAERVLAARARYVARGISTPAIVVDRAAGSTVWDVDGYLHQCFMVGTYEPYVEVCRRLAELSPCRGEAQKSILVNSGAEAIENAVKIARAASGRPAVSSSSTASTAGRC